MLLSSDELYKKSMTESAYAIQLDNVQLSLPSLAGTVDILRGVSLQVETGKTLAITGPSGSGKTSMMMLMAGLEKPTSGNIRICGQDITHANEDVLALFRRKHIGIVFQSFHLLPTMTALENVCIPLEFSGVTSPASIALEALGAVGLAHRTDHYPSQLSGGEQQRVAIARAFATKPKLLLADEPTGNLDVGTGKQIIELLFNLHQSRGTTLALITHDPGLAALCNRSVTMVDGKLNGN